MNQDKFYSEVWGELTFFPTKGFDGRNCSHCLLNCDWCENECVNAPCVSVERKDGRNGYFSIHEMPVEKAE